MLLPRFEPLSTGLVHILVSPMLPQISAGKFGCRWQADGIRGPVHGRGSLFDIYSLLHFFLVPVGFTGKYFSVLHGH